jgi:hypothetical protein
VAIVDLLCTIMGVQSGSILRARGGIVNLCCYESQDQRISYFMDFAFVRH